MPALFWRCVALALVACEVPPPDPAPVVATFEVAPAPSVWPLGRSAGRIGRGVAPQPVTARAIAGREKPLGTAAVWPIEAPGAAMAVATRGNVVELIDVDGARLVWRATCDAPVVGTSAAGIVCGDGNGVTVLDLNGRPKWHHAGAFVALTGARAVVADGGGVAVLDLVKGAEVEHATVPAGATVLASCEHTLIVALADHRLARLVDGKQAWAVATAPVPPPKLPAKPVPKPPITTDVVVGIDGCSAALIARVEGMRGSALVAISDAGKLLGRVDDVRGWWIARDDPQRLEVAAGAQVASWNRSLTDAHVLDLPPLGPLIATRGERRLVRVSRHAAAVIDRKGTRAYVELAETTAALGDEAILAGGAALRAFTLPRPWSRALPRSASAPVYVDAELRDLPAAVTVDASAAPALAGDDREISAAALAGRALIVATDRAIARVELAPIKWSWRIASAPIVALAASEQLVVFATAAKTTAVDREGKAGWERAEVADALEVAGEHTLVRARGRTLVLGPDGRSRGELPATVATILELEGMTLVIAAEQGRIVARLPAAWMAPVWSVEVAGVVASIQRTRDGAIVALDDGDAYHLDARTGAAAALPAIGLAWRAQDDLVTGEALGGPIPPSPIVPPAGKPEVYKPTDLEAAPAIATPWPPPPPMPASWQLTLFEPSGALRVRNDYPLVGAITPAVRGAGAPLVYRAGRDAVVIDPRRGDPLRRATLPDELGLLFSTVVDGKPVVGTILAAPLRAVVF